MKKGWKWTLISLGIIGAGVGLYFLVKKPKNKWENDSSNDEVSSNRPTIFIDNSFPLKKNSGDINQSVKRVTALQKYLESQGATLDGGSDGKFGPSTQTAVETYIDAGGKVTETFYNDNIKTYE